MAIKFEFYELPDTIGTREKRCRARVVNWQRINTDFWHGKYSTAPRSPWRDVRAIRYLAQRELTYYLKDGVRVATRRDRIFPYIAYLPETRTPPSSTRANKVKFKSVTFRRSRIPEASVEQRQDRAFSKYKHALCPVTKEV